MIGHGSGDGYGDGYGDGDGDGSGYGDGSGDGDGSGYGDGYGDGYGSGYGYGDGYSDGSGSGDGDGYGYGSGYGYGDGYGDGDGSGLKPYWDALRENHGENVFFWRSDQSGQPSNGGGTIKQAAPGVIHESPGPLEVCGRGSLHATDSPWRWGGERIWLVKMHGQTVKSGDKVAALKREILCEITRPGGDR
jgi:hypothetical protein